MLRIEVRPDGIFYVKPMSGAHSGLEEAKESFEAIATLSKGKQVLILNDFRKHPKISVDREAREFTASQEAAQVIRAFAVLVDSPVGKVFGNFWMGFNKPSYPTRLFTNEQAAVDWLLQFTR